MRGASIYCSTKGQQHPRRHFVRPLYGPGAPRVGSICTTKRSYTPEVARHAINQSVVETPETAKRAVGCGDGSSTHRIQGCTPMARTCLCACWQCGPHASPSGITSGPVVRSGRWLFVKQPGCSSCHRAVFPPHGAEHSARTQRGA